MSKAIRHAIDFDIRAGAIEHYGETWERASSTGRNQWWSEDSHESYPGREDVSKFVLRVTIHAEHAP